mmetsp:Transcript_80860/g.187735  ORF Transcript_80860/g.187735 Transcript_80860/m.187735 type:complete len:711 (-) Transcript_80860:91-2223(-)
MQSVPLLAWAILLCCCSGGNGRVLASEHPIEKVIVMLKSLHEQATTEGQSEEVTYAKFEKWCTDSLKTLGKAITTSKQSIDVLGTTIEGKAAENATLTESIDQLAQEILRLEATGLGTEATRTKAADLYAAADKDYEDTITAIDAVIAELEGVRTATSGASMVQAKLEQLQRSRLLTSEQKAALSIGNSSTPRPDILAKGNYEASVKKYAFKSGNVIELLKSLKLKFEDDRVAATKAETNALNAYELAKAARANALAAANAAKIEKGKLIGEVQTELADAKASLKNVMIDLHTDTTSYSDTEKTCTMKASEWQDRSEIRQKELQAIEKGIEILAKVAGVRTEAPVNPSLPVSPVTPPGTALLQDENPAMRAVNLLRKEASQVHSHSLARFAEEIAAKAGGPFDEIKNMIQKMIFRLMAEQKDEDEHKNWCDLELEKTSASKVNKEEKISVLGAKITEAKATLALLTNEIAAADEMATTIMEHMDEATRIREVGKQENELAVKDARDAQEALAQAEAVLVQFYKDSGAVPKESWELLQRGVTLPAEPSTWDAAYTGITDPSAQPDGIITLLKTISATFSQMEASTLAQEAMDKKAYDEDMKSSTIEKARRAKESEMKAQEKKRVIEKLGSTIDSLKHVEGELESVEQYLKDLNPACIEGDSTYEDRKAAREKEIQALKEAQVILSDWKKGNSSNQTAFLAPIKPVIRRETA